jgi:NADH dehydrogenase
MMDEHVVIIGGGFAGVRLAYRLEKMLPENIAISLLSEENYMLYSPLLPEVVGGTMLPAHTIAPLRQMFARTAFHRVTVEDVEFDKKRVCFRAGETVNTLSYTQLVFACGKRANLNMIEGMSEYAFPLKTVGDALEIRNRILHQLESASIEKDPEQRKRLLSFAVVGGGANGVEVAGAIYDFLHEARRYYPELRRQKAQVKLIHSNDTLLPEMPAVLGRFVQRDMEERGIEVRLNQHVTEVEDSCVHCGEERVDAATTVCSIGSETLPLIKSLELPLTKGLIQTSPDLSVPGCEGVWAIGDCAAITNNLDNSQAPPTAQFATQEAGCLAENIRRRWQQQPTQAFGYKPKGMLVTVGHHRAVARLLSVNIRGLFAWLLWRMIYLYLMPTWARRIQIFFDWSWHALFPPDMSQYHYGAYREADGRRYHPIEQETHERGSCFQD